LFIARTSRRTWRTVRLGMTATMTINKAERMPRTQGNKRIMPDVAIRRRPSACSGKAFPSAGGFDPVPEVAGWKFKVDRPLRRAMANDTRECAHYYFSAPSSPRDESVRRRTRDCSIHPASPYTSERTSGAKLKTVMIVDPDGYHLAFAEAIDQGMPCPLRSTS
jgi:hypothetical protein